MGDIIQVEPKPGAYVVEWRAVQYSIGDWQTIKRLLRPLGFVVFVDLEPSDGPILVLVRQGISVRLSENEWVVISPHDKLIVLDDATFNEQFTHGDTSDTFVDLLMHEMQDPL